MNKQTDEFSEFSTTVGIVLASAHTTLGTLLAMLCGVALIPALPFIAASKRGRQWMQDSLNK